MSVHIIRILFTSKSHILGAHELLPWLFLLKSYISLAHTYGQYGGLWCPYGVPLPFVVSGETKPFNVLISDQICTKIRSSTRCQQSIYRIRACTYGNLFYKSFIFLVFVYRCLDLYAMKYYRSRCSLC